MGNRRKVLADIGRTLTRGMQGMANPMLHSGCRPTRAISISTMRQARHARILFAFGSTDSSTGLCKQGRISFFMFISFSSVPIGVGGICMEGGCVKERTIVAGSCRGLCSPASDFVRILSSLRDGTGRLANIFTLANIATFPETAKPSVAFPNECHTMGR